MRRVSTSASVLARLRLALAAIVVLASLLAASAWWKRATCDCGSSGLPWDTIAVAATISAAAAIAVYVFVTALTRQRTD
jgi:hypothetical protein